MYRDPREGRLPTPGRLSHARSWSARSSRGRRRYVREEVHTTDRPPALFFPYFLPTQMPTSLLSTWQSLRAPPGPILARYHVDSWSTRTVSIPHRPLTHLRFLFTVASLHAVAYVITPPRLFPCAALPILSHLRPILLHSSHSMSCPPPAPRFRYAAMPLSADCTATPFRPTFVASVSISSLALHIRLHPLSYWLPRLLRAVLLDWIRRY
ncbi:hypothetical protein B0H14DRAFT_1193087 [Mycena olivaceomarginata]|nr:hypothetical protein B0H14DRAFT_1193087 [Mycena olivaceomarginata]